MEPLKYIQEKFQIDPNQPSPIKLPIDRFRGLTGLFNELGFKIGAEIGVDNGRYSKWICIKVKKSKLFLIDPYLAYPEYVECHKKEDQKEADQHYENAKTRLAKFNVEFIRKTSMEAVKDFKDNSLDFVFIDGNHQFQYITNDIAEWGKKVRLGGIISGHDYGRSSRSKEFIHVKDVVSAWTYSHGIHPWFIMRDNRTVSRGISWMWVKE